MPYFVIIAKGAVRISKNFLPAIKSILVREFELIAQNPYQAPRLNGKFAFLRSWHVYLKGVPYRIIFEIEDGSRRVLVHLVAKRADAYKLLERLF
jgi:mRNA-degrading endonuclease RelE of RelBE toxin-antitoxin system